MAEVIPFRRREHRTENVPLVEKFVDGERIECVDVDRLSAIQRLMFFERGRLAENCPANH
ncbi:hypothetical protein [Rhizobium rhizogenes]|uniref:hypothetical protein n=1 Tax=Rhizobium rhizogenes TaxID=359 RepID=UPI0015743845|nr:hypothetical protein [Rhizobium rhizogenes]NTI74240.1 hypothetical protein [Rhizobium rhizogenes]